jgi:hypothetical protein
MERLLFIDDTFIELPESWDDVTFEQFVKLQVCDNVDLNAVSILTGVSKEDWANSNKTSLYYYCMNSISKWITSGINEINDSEIRKIKWMSETMEFGDLGENTVAQFEDAKILLAKYDTLYKTHPFDAMDKYYPLICSIYLQPKASKEKYNFGKAEALVSQIRTLPAPMVIGVVNFFLLRFIVSQSGIEGSAPKQISAWKKLKLGLERSIKRLAFRLYLTAWQKETLKKRIILSN